MFIFSSMAKHNLLGSPTSFYILWTFQKKTHKTRASQTNAVEGLSARLKASEEGSSQQIAELKQLVAAKERETSQSTCFFCTYFVFKNSFHVFIFIIICCIYICIHIHWPPIIRHGEATGDREDGEGGLEESGGWYGVCVCACVLVCSCAHVLMCIYCYWCCC